ncbi:hypothetical protein NE865_13694 [Phthorimaea operculella]|nr:hypothetical protein NE865_13694 [Phthorimaea operculella]
MQKQHGDRKRRHLVSTWPDIGDASVRLRYASSYGTFYSHSFGGNPYTFPQHSYASSYDTFSSHSSGGFSPLEGRVPRSLINRALRLCHPDYIDSELDHVREVLSSNGYELKQSLRIANSSNKQKPHTVERRPIYLPFVKGVTDKIGFLLSRKFNIKTIFRPHTQIKRWLRSPKDKERLSGPGVYEIPCECGKSYIGETQRHVSTRVTEHIRSVKNRNTLQSAIAEHSLDSDANHYIRFDKAAVLAREKFFVPRKIREAIEISRRPNFNRDSGWFLPQSWKPVLRAALPTGLQAVKSEDIVSVVCTDRLVGER